MKVCAIVVTYNRYALLHQSTPVDILLIDNASTDGTFENLYKEGYLNKSAIYYKNLENNQGGARGFTRG